MGFFGFSHRILLKIWVSWWFDGYQSGSKSDSPVPGKAWFNDHRAQQKSIMEKHSEIWSKKKSAKSCINLLRSGMTVKLRCDLKWCCQAKYIHHSSIHLAVSWRFRDIHSCLDHYDHSSWTIPKNFHCPLFLKQPNWAHCFTRSCSENGQSW